MEAKIEEISKTFHDFWMTWARRANQADTLHDILSFFDEEVTAIGTGEHEQGKCYEEVIQNFRDDFAEIEVPIQIDFFREKTRLIAPTVGLVEAEANLEIALEEGSTVNFHLRFSTIFTQVNGLWKLSHNHVSIPSDGQNIGQSYPIDKLKAKNDRLQKLVDERTNALQKRTLQLKKEKEKTENLLHNILPKVVANELMAKGEVMPTNFENVSVLFTDFVGFTKITSSISPEDLVKELNDIFHQFDKVIKAEEMEKIKTIGDSYMAVCGLPEANPAHALRSIQAAKKMLTYLEQRNEQHQIEWKMRIGIHSGPVMAGVVGCHKFSYDLWGNTVNIASRLENASEAGKINVSSQTSDLIKDYFSCDYRGKIEVKGGEQIDMYFIA